MNDLEDFDLRYRCRICGEVEYLEDVPAAHAAVSVCFSQHCMDEYNRREVVPERMAA